MELLRFPRGPWNDPMGEILRVSLDVFEGEGRRSRYVSVRRWYRAQGGAYRPTKQGVTVRAGEIGRVLEVLEAIARELGAGAEGERR